MTDHAEREPAPRRKTTYPGDKRGMAGNENWVGPDRRGILWRPVHDEYDTETDRTAVIFAPVSVREIEQIPGLKERIQAMQQTQAHRAGAFEHIGGRQ